MSESLQRYVRGQVEPLSDPDTAIREVPRAGSIQRDKCENWLNQCWADGYLSESEHEARLKAARTAVTIQQLKGLTFDLPSCKAPSEPARRRPVRNTWKKKPVRCTVWGMLGVASLNIGVLSGVYHTQGWTFFTFIVALVSFIGAVTALLIEADR